MDKQTLVEQIDRRLEAYFHQMIHSEIKSLIDTIDEKLISANEACKIFEPPISNQTIRKWAKEGKVPVYYQGRLMFFRKSEVLEACKQLKKYHQ